MSCIETLKKGGVAVIATDTIYGVVASAKNEAAVLRVYAIKGRAPEKPCIILISSIDDLAAFGTAPNAAQRATLERVWPGPLSVILPCTDSTYTYLHRGTQSLAFRLPADEMLRALLTETGPLIAPSANPQGAEPATTIEEAQNYFGDQVDCYADAGVRVGKPSRLISVAEDGTEAVLRA